MKKQQVTQILQEIVEQEVPDNVDLWPAIRARVKPRRRSSRWVQWMPATRLGWAFMALVLCLAFGAVAYAVVPVVSRLFQQEAGLRHVEQANLVQELNLSQTIDGVTVTLERAYADANRIVVGFTIKDPNGQRYDAHHLTLTDMAGTVFSGTIGFGVTGQSDILKVSLPPGEGAYVLAFDAAPVEGAPAELDLRLEMEVVEALPLDAFEPPPTLIGPPDEPPASMVVEALPVPEGDIVALFTFEFSVPFIPGRVAEVNQTVEAAGIPICLERVVVTPSETRAYLRLDSPGGAEMRWIPTAMLKAPGDEESQNHFAYSANDDPPIHRYAFLAPLYERRGEWTLTVTELVGTAIERLESQILRQADSAVVSVDAAEFQTRLAGPWVFRFRVP